MKQQKMVVIDSEEVLRYLQGGEPSIGLDYIRDEEIACDMLWELP